MKSVLYMCVVLIVFLLGCGLMQSDKVKAFMPGVYVRHYTDEYTNSYDTITIKGVDDKYEVIKRTKFIKLTDNGKMQPGYTLQNGQAIMMININHCGCNRRAKPFILSLRKRN